MINLFRLARLENYLLNGDAERFLSYYESHDFGPKYQLLADLLHASMLAVPEKLDEAPRRVRELARRSKRRPRDLDTALFVTPERREQARRSLGELARKVRSHPYYNHDTILYLENFVHKHLRRAFGELDYRIDPRRRPLNPNKVDPVIKSVFWHGEDYLPRPAEWARRDAWEPGKPGRNRVPPDRKRVSRPRPDYDHTMDAGPVAVSPGTEEETAGQG